MLVFAMCAVMEFVGVVTTELGRSGKLRPSVSGGGLARISVLGVYLANRVLGFVSRELRTGVGQSDKSSFAPWCKVRWVELLTFVLFRMMDGCEELWASRLDDVRGGGNGAVLMKRKVGRDRLTVLACLYSRLDQGTTTRT